MREVLTFAAEEHEGYSIYFDKSCKQLGGYKPVTLSGTSRISAIVKHLKSLDPEAVVLLVNRSSVVFSGSLDPMFDKYESELKLSKKELLWVASQPIGLFGALFSYVYKASNVIGDVMVGQAKTLLDLFGVMDDTCSATEEQKRIIEYFDTHPQVNVKLDNLRWFFVFLTGQAILYSNLSFRDDPELPPGIKRVVYHTDDEKYKPCLIYRDAGSDMTGIIKQLGYRIEPGTVFKQPSTGALINAISYCKEAMTAAFNKGKALF